MAADVEKLHELVDEGLDFFDLAGDEGDKLYVRAIRQHIAAKDAEIEALRNLCGAAYQLAGVHDAPEVWLDALSAAASGHPFSTDGLLPYMPQAVCEAEARADQLAQALDMLPIEIYMVEHNPDYGPLMFCCGREVKSQGLNGLIAHSDGCWYKQMCAIRDHYKEGKGGDTNYRPKLGQH